MLTVAYITSRLEPKIEWFLKSLHRECGGNYSDIRLVVVDFHHDAPSRFEGVPLPPGTIHTSPKPTVWQGPNRLTKEDYFAASNTRNTAICMAPDGWVAFVDDLSVLMPGWLQCVRQAMDGGYIVLGAYKKVYGLVVEDGLARQWTEFPQGIDSRWSSGRDKEPVRCPGAWLYGCSFAGPVAAFLAINGFDEDCDGMGYEDCFSGIMIENAGYAFMYNRTMLTLESEELHHVGAKLKRIDKGESPKDKSHAMLDMVNSNRKRSPNYFGPDGIAGLRAKILAGGSFPECKIPQHDWFDGQPLREM